jgi:hypothetical protein
MYLFISLILLHPLPQMGEDKRVYSHVIKKKTGELTGMVGLRDVNLEAGTAGKNKESEMSER